MHNADNEVTQEDLAAVDTIGGHMASYYEFGQSDEYAAAQEAARDFRLASIEAACREKDAEIARLQAANIDIGYDLRRVKAERDQLRAKLDEAGQILMAVVDFEEDHTDPACQDKHPFLARARAFLASAPQPTPPASEEG